LEHLHGTGNGLDSYEQGKSNKTKEKRQT